MPSSRSWVLHLLRCLVETEYRVSWDCKESVDSGLPMKDCRCHHVHFQLVTQSPLQQGLGLGQGMMGWIGSQVMPGDRREAAIHCSLQPLEIKGDWKQLHFAFAIPGWMSRADAPISWRCRATKTSLRGETSVFFP